MRGVTLQALFRPSADETFPLCPISRQAPRSTLGKKIFSYIDSSDSELNSEDEVELLGDSWDVVKPKMAKP